MPEASEHHSRSHNVHSRKHSDAEVGGYGVLDLATGNFDEEDHEALAATSSSMIRFYPESWTCCSIFQRRERAHGRKATWMEELYNACLCPPSGTSARVYVFLLTYFLIWALLFFILEHVSPVDHYPSPAGPGGPIFGLAILHLVGLFVGIVFRFCRLPSLLGPLVLGIAMKNIEPINIFRNLEGWDTRNCSLYRDENETLYEECYKTARLYSGSWITPIRQIALTVILTRAGLELSPKQLKKLRGAVPMLAFGPCLVEACCCALVTYLLFNVFEDEFPIEIPMCFVAGFALAAVSPAVVVPSILALKKKGYGVIQGVSTLLIAASSIDDVLAISLYTIFLGLAIPHQPEEGDDPETIKHEQILTYVSGPSSVIVGIICGIIFGMILHFFPAKDSPNKAVPRLTLLLLINVTAMVGFEKIEVISGAGSLSVLVASFIASFGWRSQRHWKKPMHKIEKLLSEIWTLIVPLLFGTIGNEMDFHDPTFTQERLLKILAIIAICLVIRCITAYVMVWIGCRRFNWKERLFCALSWIPKATVQAALAPLVVSFVQAKVPDSKAYQKHGEIVVTIAVLAIIITAPLGSILIALTGPKLLQLPGESDDPLYSEFPDGDDESRTGVQIHTKNQVSFDDSGSPPVEMSGIQSATSNFVSTSNFASTTESTISANAAIQTEGQRAEPSPKKMKKASGSILNRLI